jgi:cyanobactin maturation PatA/PatG family protease
MSLQSAPVACERGYDRRQEPNKLHRESGGEPSLLLSIAGIEALWSWTRGDSRVCVAILDGPVDRSHPSLRGANLQQLDGPAPGQSDDGPACRHGTHVASILFGQDDGPVRGIAPGCRGVVVPIFESLDGEAFRSCSQLDLARALTQAVLAGAHIINVSGGQFSPSGMAHPLLADVVRDCARRGVLIVAAAGNEGCECLHVPAALESVLAVGAMDGRGEPLGFSNWGDPYRTQGIVAPGEQIPGARAGGGVVWASGTSYATALVSGLAALLCSLQLGRGHRLAPHLVRAAILAGAKGGPKLPADERYLAGRLDVLATLSFLTHGTRIMTESTQVQASDLPGTSSRITEESFSAPAPGNGEATRQEIPAEQTEQSPRPRSEKAPAEQPQKPASCGCGAAPALVYALGQIGYDFRSEARLDSIVQKMAGAARLHVPERGYAYDPQRMLEHLKKYPSEAAAIEWTLSLDGTVIYAIRPQGPFAAEVYNELRRFLQERFEEGVERISVPGVVAGKTTLLNGQVVPVIVPELRGMYSWTTAALVDAVAGASDEKASEKEQKKHAQKREGVRNFLSRVYYELRNLGLTPQDRALNYAATNAFEMGEIYAAAIKEEMELDHVEVSPSPIGRPGSDCHDVEVYLFYPGRQVQTVRKVYRFTVDVSDTVPVTVGTMRAWFTR